MHRIQQLAIFTGGFALSFSAEDFPPCRLVLSESSSSKESRTGNTMASKNADTFEILKLRTLNSGEIALCAAIVHLLLGDAPKVALCSVLGDALYLALQLSSCVQCGD